MIISWIIEVLLLVLQLFTFYLYIPLLPYKKGKKGTILIVTDILTPPFFYFIMRHYFKKSDYQVFFYYCYNPFVSIYKHSQRLSQKLTQSDLKKITLIGHGNGGLISLSLSDEARKKIHRIITLDTPFWGSQIYRYLTFLPIFKDIVPRSEYLLTYKMNALLYEEFYPIVAWQDEWIFPETLLKFGQGRDIILDIPGRLNLILHFENIQTLVQFCDQFFIQKTTKSAPLKSKTSKKTQKT
ncbi:MAG: hypothetical protein NZ853_00170 [Leptospiraceae bacterium]|nr:hypothetical protein [Leptospiraceae bacterium]